MSEPLDSGWGCGAEGYCCWTQSEDDYEILVYPEGSAEQSAAAAAAGFKVS